MLDMSAAEKARVLQCGSIAKTTALSPTEPKGKDCGFGYILNDKVHPLPFPNAADLSAALSFRAGARTTLKSTWLPKRCRT